MINNSSMRKAPLSDYKFESPMKIINPSLIFEPLSIKNFDSEGIYLVNVKSKTPCGSQ